MCVTAYLRRSGVPVRPCQRLGVGSGARGARSATLNRLLLEQVPLLDLSTRHMELSAKIEVATEGTRGALMGPHARFSASTGCNAAGFLADTPSPVVAMLLYSSVTGRTQAEPDGFQG